MLERLRQHTQSRGFWLIVGIFLVEALLLFTGGASNPFPITRFSLLVATLVLIAGILPAAMLPTTPSLLAACFAVVLASVLVLPFDPTWLIGPVRGIDLPTLPPALIVRLINAAMLGPIALHFVARLGRQRMANRALAICYGITLALLGLVLLAPAGWLRNGGAALLALWTGGLFITALGLLAGASRNQDMEQHRSAQQARLLLVGVLLAELPILLRPILTRFGVAPSYNTLLAAQLVLPLTIAYAMLQHDLFGVDAALRRALVYATMLLGLLVVYFGLTLGLTALLIRTVPQFSGAAALVGLVAAALAFEPAQRRVQAVIDRSFYPERLTFQTELGAAQTTLTQVVNRENIRELLTHDLPQRLAATWAWLGLAPAFTVPPAEHAAAWSAELTVGGRVLGRYWLGPRRTGLPYDATEQAQLRALAQQAALALAYAETFDTLAALNRDLEQQVVARTEQVVEQQRALAVIAERQRLARDMHDSVTQTLFSINLGARALRGLVQHDTTAAVAALDEQERAAQQALAEMRALLAQLRSPQLTDTDLATALRQQSALLRQHYGLAVTLDLAAPVAISPPLAEALLYIAKEALHNVVKHSGASQAQLRLACEHDTLVLAISDAGCSFDQAAIGGNSFGLRGMHERVAAFCGTLAIDATPGAGTTVQVTIPIGNSDHD